MKLISYTPKNTERVNQLIPTIILNQKFGGNVLNLGAAKLLSISNGSYIELHQDEENKCDWYLSVGDRKGFKVKDKKIDSRLYFQSAPIARKLLHSLGYSENTAKIRISDSPIIIEGLKCWPLITKALVK